MGAGAGPAEILRQAIALHQRGELAHALSLYKQIVPGAIEHFDALHFSGVIALQRGDAATAAELIGRAVRLDPTSAIGHLNHAMALQARGEIERALESLGQAIAHQPGLAEAYFRRGLVLADTGRLADALADFDRTIALDDAHTAVHFRRGVLLERMHRPDLALTSYDRIVAAHPHDADALFNRGNALRKLGRLTDASASYTQALAVRPTFVEAVLNRGNVFKELGRWEPALADFDRAVALAGKDPEVLCNRGAILHELGRFQQALDCYDEALALAPGGAEIHNNRGLALQSLGKVAAALASFDRALALEQEAPGVRLNRSMALLLTGDFRRGWLEFESRWQGRSPAANLARRRFSQPLWLGSESLRGRRILLYAEQGFGDTLQFCRYVRPVADLGAEIILAVPQALMKLLKGLPGVSHLVADNERLPDFDYHCPLLSLPRAFGTTLDSIPAALAWPQGGDPRASYWRERLGVRQTTRVGLVWSGGFRPDQPELWSINRRRNIPLWKLAPLRGLPVEFYSLQKGEAARAELHELVASGWPGPEIVDFSEDLHDFADTAALVASLDLVISVDTATAHLAATSGKPVWLLNRYDTCWRWLLERTDSPWYPTVRLYRQPSPGDWEAVVTQVRADLKNLCKGKSQPDAPSPVKIERACSTPG